jgi:hypothetical protein
MKSFRNKIQREIKAIRSNGYRINHIPTHFVERTRMRKYRTRCGNNVYNIVETILNANLKKNDRDKMHLQKLFLDILGTNF